MIPPEVTTIAAELTSSGPVPEVAANFTAIGLKLTMI
jgi:hypothetical protein